MLPKYCRCAPAEGGPAVWLRLEAVDRLESEVLDAFRSLSARGSEIGGVLLGRWVGDGVVIEDFRTVPASYRRGPLYLLTTEEKDAFHRTAAGLSSRVVGFFRSNTRKDLALSEEDAALAGVLRTRRRLALLIKPFASRPARAGVFFGAESGPPSVEFVFRTSELAPARLEPPCGEAASPATPAIGSAPVGARMRTLWFALAAVVLAVLFAAVWAAFGERFSGRHQPFDSSKNSSVSELKMY